MSQRFGELLGEAAVVLFFFGVEAEVFEEEGLAGLEVVGEFFGDLADAVRGEADVFIGAEDVIEQFAEAHDDGAQAHGVDALALGAAEVGGEDDLGLVADRVLDGGDGLADARVVGDEAVLEGDVEVDTDEDALVGEIEVADGELGHWD